MPLARDSQVAGPASTSNAGAVHNAHNSSGRTFAQITTGKQPTQYRPTSAKSIYNMDPFIGLKREHGIQCHFIQDATMDAYLAAVGDIVDPKKIIAASKCEKQAKIFFTSPEEAATIVANGLNVNGHFLEVYPVGAPSINIILSGVPPFVSNEAVLNVLRLHGQVTTNIRYMSLNSKLKGFEHIKSFRRQCRIRLPPGRDMPDQIHVPHENDIYTIYLSADAMMRCDICRSIGHPTYICRRKKQPQTEARPVNKETAPEKNKPTIAAEDDDSSSDIEDPQPQGINDETIAAEEDDSSSDIEDPQPQSINDEDTLIGNAQPPPTKHKTADDAEASEDESEYEDDLEDMQVEDDASVWSFQSSQSSQAESIESAYNSKEVEVFLGEMKSVRKIAEKAKEITDIPKMLTSLKRYRKSTRLSQNDEKRITRVYNALKEHQKCQNA